MFLTRSAVNNVACKNRHSTYQMDCVFMALPLSQLDSETYDNTVYACAIRIPSHWALGREYVEAKLCV